MCSVIFLSPRCFKIQRGKQRSWFLCSPVVELVVRAPELATPPRTPRHPPPLPLPPLPSPSPKAQPVRGSGYCGHAHFSIMSSSACRKRKPLVQPETLEHSTRDSSLSSALHFHNEIPLPLSLSLSLSLSFFLSLSQRAVGGGREKGKEGGRSVAAAEKKIVFFSFLCKVSES